MIGEHLFWITSRAAGVVALLASSAAVTIGLLIGARQARPRSARHARGAVARDDRRARRARAGALLGDGYLAPDASPTSTIPFVSSYERVVDGRSGIIGGWLMVRARALVLRARRGSASRAGASCTGLTALAWMLGRRARARRQGTDAGAAWFVVGLRRHHGAAGRGCWSLRLAGRAAATGAGVRR